MPIAATFDGLNRRIFLDASVADTSWSPLDLYREYLTLRRDDEQFRGFEPLLRMRGGEPKGGGRFAPRFLQMQTDRRGITTKLVPPDVGPYRTRVAGELSTDVADTDPEPFDTSGLTTAVIIDYEPADAEIISVSTGSDSGGVSPDPTQLEISTEMDRDILIISGTADVAVTPPLSLVVTNGNADVNVDFLNALEIESCRV